MIELYEHQKTALDLLRLNDGFALFMEMGTGKTFPVLKRLVELYITGRINSALIVAPKSVCESWKDKMGMLTAGSAVGTVTSHKPAFFLRPACRLKGFKIDHFVTSFVLFFQYTIYLPKMQGLSCIFEKHMVQWSGTMNERIKKR